MENTVIEFIINNIFLFLPLGVAGIVITIFLLVTSKRESLSEPDNLESDYKTLFNIRMNIYVIIYFFIWIMVIIIGLLSNFIIPTLISGVLAAIPLIVMILSDHLTKKSKVS
jgi:bacteriorhodopsin